MKNASIINLILAYASQLKFKKLFLVIAGLFVLDLIIPDMIPMIDEIILGLLTIILANWKKEKARDKQGNIIEGEIIDDNNN